jgi:hypothetical protein
MMNLKVREEAQNTIQQSELWLEKTGDDVVLNVTTGGATYRILIINAYSGFLYRSDGLDKIQNITNAGFSLDAVGRIMFYEP